MSRRPPAKHDRALSDDDDDDAPGAAVTSRMHELQSDSDDEGREGEIDIDEDDVDRDPPAVANASASSLQELPSYKALMSSLGAKHASTSPGSAVGSSSLSPGAAAPAASSSSSSAAASASKFAPDADENHGYLADDPAAAADASDDSDGDADDLSPKSVGPGGVRHSFESMYARAERLEKKGFLRKAASYYLYCLEHYRYSHQHQDLIASCLRRLGDICYRNKKYKEALQFRSAERMVYEANLMRVVKNDAAKEQAIAAAATAGQAGAATAASSSNSATSSSPSSSSASASASASRAPLVASAGPASQIMSLQSSDPTPLPRTPLTPASLLAEEERALTFERLAKVFFDEKNLDMARSYASKAIALRRRIKEKWGDPATMDKDQLLLHQLAVMGQEQYESTLRRFKGQPDSTPAMMGAELGLDSDHVSSSDAATAKLQYDMAQSLQALASGRLNSVSSGGGGKSSGSRKPPASVVDDGDDSKEESEETMRQRRVRAAATAATAAAGKKKVAFDSSAAAGAASSVSESSGQQVASVVNESSGLVLSAAAKRRALLLSLGVGFLILVLAIAVISYQFKDQLFPLAPRPVQHTRPPNAADRLGH